MPKTFPPPPPRPEEPPIDVGIGHPVAAVSAPPPPRAVPTLGDLLFSGADERLVAEHLRAIRDEWNANLLAEWLCRCRDWLPDFRRAERDGAMSATQVLENQERIAVVEHMRPDSLTADGWSAREKLLSDLYAERRRVNELSACGSHAQCALLAVRQWAPSLLDDPRSQKIGDVVSADELLERRLWISNFMIEHKLSVFVDQDGWPRSDARRRETAGTVRLVTVERATPGIRMS